MDALIRHRMRKTKKAWNHAASFRSEDGSTTLEFAVAAPVVLLLIIGSMVAMLGLLVFGNATYATGLGARYASLHGAASNGSATSQTVAAEVQSHLWLGRQTAQITTAWSAGNVPGSSVTVNATLVLPLAVPFTSVNQLTVSASSMRVITR